MLQNIDPNNRKGNTLTLSMILKTSMAKQGISLRQLSRISGIPAASLSKIINNKQQVGIRHLQLFSQHLNVPIEHLLSSIGIEIELKTGRGENEKMGIDGFGQDAVFILNMIKDLLHSFGIPLHSLVGDIQKELNKYEHFARTEEGREIILQQFAPKLSTVKGAGSVIDQLKSFYQRYGSNDLEESERAIIGSALLYFALSPDVIPDYAFPLGYLDDAIAVHLVAQRLSRV